ncbi:transposase-like protein [Streptomyces sp. V4I8]
MALSQDDLLRLLRSLRSSDGIELVRSVAERMLQELIEAETAAHIGAEWNEHTASRTAFRNGHRDKTLTTQAGDLDLQIPKLRTGSFFPSLLERRRRIDQALYAVIMEAYVHGVSTRSVDDLVKALGGDSGISKSEVSRICGELDEPLTAFRTRPLDHTRFPYIYLDATYCKVRVNHQIVSQAVVIATGITEDGGREVLGTAVGDSESEAFWSEFLRSLRERGLSGVRLVIADHTAAWSRRSARSCWDPPTSAVVSISCATASHTSPRGPARWSPRPSAPSSPSPPPKRSKPSWTPSPTCSASSSPRSKKCSWTRRKT